MVSLVLGSAMFAVAANSRFVRRVETHGKKRTGRRAGNRPPEPRRWTLGADILLPRGRAAGGEESDDASDEDRSLRFGHIRQGHLRFTPCGPREDRSYVLRYIAPTIVRADLPLAPMATRHAMDLPERSGT
jgi:hypothetical protein